MNDIGHDTWVYHSFFLRAVSKRIRPESMSTIVRTRGTLCVPVFTASLLFQSSHSEPYRARNWPSRTRTGPVSVTFEVKASMNNIMERFSITAILAAPITISIYPETSCPRTNADTSGHARRELGGRRVVLQQQLVFFRRYTKNEVSKRSDIFNPKTDSWRGKWSDPASSDGQFSTNMGTPWPPATDRYRHQHARQVLQQRSWHRFIHWITDQ